jgi:DNA polymerase (family 10)
MKNYDIAKILYNIAIYEDMKGEKFKPRAYEKASRSVEGAKEDLADIYKAGGLQALMELPGIGKNIAKKLEELINTGKLQYYEELKRQTPVDVENLVAIEGVGPKTVKALYEKLRITNVEELEKAATEHRIRNVPGFGEKTEQQILKGIEFFKKSKGRFILGFTLPTLDDICERLRKHESMKKVEMAGSIRRMKETIGDADFLAISDEPSKVMEYFVSMPEVVYVHAKGDTKSMVRLDSGIDCDLRIVPEESFGAALQYFTGNKQHNIELRTIALHKGWKLNEYGLFEGDSQIGGKSEEQIYEKLGMKWIPPELRENRGEIEAAQNNKLPELIGYDSLKGDLQIQTSWTDGRNSILEMAEEARKTGLEYIVITDHTKTLAMAHGLDEERLETQGNEIEQINQTVKGIRVLRGAEVNILKDGSLDVKDYALAKLDVVGAAVHSHFDLSRKEQTARAVSAMQNPNVDILFHPTGRVLKQREAYDVDMEEIIHVAKETDTILEIDAFPDRLDLSDEYIKLAIENECKLSIDSDAHATSQIQFLKFGVAQARRGWAKSDDIVNTLSLEKFLDSLK